MGEPCGSGLDKRNGCPGLWPRKPRRAEVSVASEVECGSCVVFRTCELVSLSPISGIDIPVLMGVIIWSPRMCTWDTEWPASLLSCHFSFSQTLSPLRRHLRKRQTMIKTKMIRAMVMPNMYGIRSGVCLVRICTEQRINIID